MKINLLLLFFVLAFPFLAIAQSLSGQTQEFLSLIDHNSNQKYQFKFDDLERFNMNYTPVSRKGIDFQQLSDAGTEAAFDLLSHSLSLQGYQKAREIIELEKVLYIKEGWEMRNPLKYHISIFGNPGSEGLWGWRFEGHHLSVNLTIFNDQIISSTPSFFGANPAIVAIDEQKGKQVLKKETELGFQLVNTLDPQQLEICRISKTAPRDIITGTDRKVTQLSPKGILFVDLNTKQKKVFLDLLDVYIDNYVFGFASDLKEKIVAAGLNHLSFAWAGGIQPGLGHYYRIQGPMLLIEYDNIQNNANHVHTVVRDLTNDYAEDFLQKHYEQKH